MNHVHVLDPSGNGQQFNPLTLHQSIVAACLSVRSHEGEAHTTAERVCRNVIDWLATKAEVTTRDIRRIASEQLGIYHPEAAYMYQQMDRMV